MFVKLAKPWQHGMGIQTLRVGIPLMTLIGIVGEVPFSLSRAMQDEVDDNSILLLEVAGISVSLSVHSFIVLQEVCFISVCFETPPLCASLKLLCYLLCPFILSQLIRSREDCIVRDCSGSHPLLLSFAFLECLAGC